MHVQICHVIALMYTKGVRPIFYVTVVCRVLHFPENKKEFLIIQQTENHIFRFKYFANVISPKLVYIGGTLLLLKYQIVAWSNFNCDSKHLPSAIIQYLYD
jgi:hypothetical protein